MKVVVDTNILFSHFNKNSFTRKLIENPFFQLISPEFSLIELDKYKEIICKKTNMNEKDFLIELQELKKIVSFVNKEKYGGFLNQAKKISPDPDDSDFFALSFLESTFFWTNDKLLKKQDKIPVLSTKEIIENFFG